jgi:uncharacterized integral membrane protein
MARSGGRTSQAAEGAKREQRDVVRIVAGVVVLALLIGFVLDNRKTVRVGFVFFNANVRLIWVLLIAAFLGGLVDRLVVILRRRQKKGVTKD